MPSRAIEAMSAAVNALPDYVPPGVYADTRRRWIEVERNYLALLAEQERLRAGIMRLCNCRAGAVDDTCPACELLRGVGA